MRYLVVLLALLGSAPAAADFPKTCQYNVQLEQWRIADHRLDPYEIAEAGRWDLNVALHHWALGAQVKAAHPHVRVLYQLTFMGARPEPLAAWQLPDTAWDATAWITHVAWANEQRGVRWFYRRTDGSLVPTIWGQRACNLTSACPRGVYGSTRGLTYAEWCERVLPRCWQSAEFRAGYDGVSIDTFDYVNGWLDSWRGLDYNRDGIADDHYGYWYWWDAIWNRQPWEVEKYAAMGKILAAWRKTLARPRLLVISGDWPLPYVGAQADGLKSEYWARCKPYSPRFSDWWDGFDLRLGVQEIGRKLIAPDSALIGIVHAAIPEAWATSRQREWARVCIAASMMVDYGIVALSIQRADDSYLLFVPPELDLWRCDRALGPCYWSGTKLCRRFSQAGRVVTVTIETAGPPDAWRAWLTR